MTSEGKAEPTIEPHLDLDDAVETRDFTKWMWLGVIALFIVMGIALYLNSGLNPTVSMVRARHILVKFDERDPTERAQALTRIRDIRERVLNGEDFSRLARDNSNDPVSASKGGDLGYVTHAMLDPMIDQYIWSAPVGQLSDIIQTKFGFHIVVVDDRRLSEADAFEARRREQAGQNPAGAAQPAPAAAPAPR